VDEQLSAPAEVVFVHGDFHAYNQLWDARRFRVLLVADFETSGAAEPEYDFRVIPSFGPGVDLLTSTVEQYTELTGRRLSVERIMALHLCTTLGDALWRSEVGLPLLLPRPGGGTPGDYVDELAARFALLGMEPCGGQPALAQRTRADAKAGLKTSDDVRLANGHLRGRPRSAVGTCSDAVNDLRAVDPLEVNAGHPQIAVPELPLDHDERHVLVRELDGVSMSELVGREAPTDARRFRRSP
jgi:hypothetical protein